MEFEGNTIHQKFMDTFSSVMMQSYCRLQYLGISNTTLNDRNFYFMLQTITSNTSLCAINASHNGLNHTSQTKEAFKFCLRGNKTLRCLDLSSNRFTVESAKAIHMAVLENDSLNILRLIGNSACNAQEYKLLQEKLAKNRKHTNDQVVQFNLSNCNDGNVTHTSVVGAKTLTSGGQVSQLPQAISISRGNFS